MPSVIISWKFKVFSDKKIRDSLNGSESLIFIPDFYIIINKGEQCHLLFDDTMRLILNRIFSLKGSVL